jgi:hypothetical protein
MGKALIDQPLGPTVLQLMKEEPLYQTDAILWMSRC